MANLSVNNGEIHHYRLAVSLIPSNIDVWGWKKWYLPSSAKIDNVRELKDGPHLMKDNAKTIKKLVHKEKKR